MHYEFLEDKLEMRGMSAFRIRALVDIPDQDVEKGDIGGFVCKYSVLSEKAWVGGNATVWQSTLDGHIRVDDGASVEKSTLKKNCQILEDSWVFNSEVEGLYSKGESKVRESKLVMVSNNGFGFLLENDSGLKSCHMTYTSEKDEKIWCRGMAELVDCKVMGNCMEFSGNTLIKYSQLEGEAFFFEDVELVRSLTLTGKQANFKQVKKLIEVEMKNVFQVDFVGAIEMEHSHIKSESIALRGDGIVIEHTAIVANLVTISDSVEMKHVNMIGIDVHLTDYVSVIGNTMERVHIGDRVKMSDMVSIRIDKGKEPMSFANENLSGDMLLTGL